MTTFSKHFQHPIATFSRHFQHLDYIFSTFPTSRLHLLDISGTSLDDISSTFSQQFPTLLTTFFQHLHDIPWMPRTGLSKSGGAAEGMKRGQHLTVRHVTHTDTHPHTHTHTHTHSRPARHRDSVQSRPIQPLPHPSSKIHLIEMAKKHGKSIISFTS